jgi:hypothetical protein
VEVKDEEVGVVEADEEGHHLEVPHLPGPFR